MEETKVISGNTPEEVWNKINADFANGPDLLEYSVVIEQSGRYVTLDIDIDLGGGFEGGYALTRLISSLKNFDDFRFVLHRQDFTDGIGKFLGMQDISLGYLEFDKQIIVKTNHPDRLKSILLDSSVRDVILSLPAFDFHIGHHHSSNTQVESAYLELRIEEGITDPARLRTIYDVFILVLDKADLESAQ